MLRISALSAVVSCPGQGADEFASRSVRGLAKDVFEVIANGVGADPEVHGKPGGVISLDQEPQNFAFAGAEPVLGGVPVDEIVRRSGDLSDDRQHHAAEPLGAGFERHELGGDLGAVGDAQPIANGLLVGTGIEKLTDPAADQVEERLRAAAVGSRR